MRNNLKALAKRYGIILSAAGALAGAGLGARLGAEASRLEFARRLSEPKRVTGNLISGFDQIADLLAKKETKRLREVTSQIEESVRGAARAHGISLPDFALNCRLRGGQLWFDLSVYPALHSNRAALLHVTEILKMREKEFYGSLYSVFGKFAEFQGKHNLKTPADMVEYFKKRPPANPGWVAKGAGSGFALGGLSLAAIVWLAKRRAEKESHARHVE